MNLRSIALSLTLPALALSAYAFSTRTAVQEEMQAKPSKHHAVLERTVGTWDATFHIPMKEVQEEKGVLTRRMIGKLWVVEDFVGQLMGAPFHGHGATGYDPAKQKYVGTWIDSWTDRLVTYEGTYDEATNTLRSEVINKNPMTGEDHLEIHETKFEGADKMTFRMLWPVPDAEPIVTMTIVYERKK